LSLFVHIFIQYIGTLLDSLAVDSSFKCACDVFLYGCSAVK
jgi:hypothetical protein